MMPFAHWRCRPPCIQHVEDVLRLHIGTVEVCRHDALRISRPGTKEDIMKRSDEAPMLLENPLHDLAAEPKTWAQEAPDR